MEELSNYYLLDDDVASVSGATSGIRGLGRRGHGRTTSSGVPESLTDILNPPRRSSRGRGLSLGSRRYTTKPPTKKDKFNKKDKVRIDFGKGGAKPLVVKKAEIVEEEIDVDNMRQAAEEQVDEGKKILGMKPLTFGLVAVGVLAVGFTAVILIKRAKK